MMTANQRRADGYGDQDRSARLASEAPFSLLASLCGLIMNVSIPSSKPAEASVTHCWLWARSFPFYRRSLPGMPDGKRWPPRSGSGRCGIIAHSVKRLSFEQGRHMLSFGFMEALGFTNLTETFAHVWPARIRNTSGQPFSGTIA